MCDTAESFVPEVQCCSLLFFFKQKTAYEMRISDWSSDVCSSDLQAGAVPAVGGAVQVDRQDAPLPAAHRAAQGALRRRQAEVPDGDDGALQEGEDQPRRRLPAGAAADDHLHGAVLGADGVGGAAPGAVDAVDPRPDRARPVLHPAGAQHRDHVVDARSEEHTSELQSLMRISYAVFCLKKTQNPSC